MNSFRISLMILFLTAAPAVAGDFDLSLTDESVKGQINFLGSESDVQLGTGYTNHEGARHIFNVDFHAQGQTAIGGLPAVAGIGMRGLYWDQNEADGRVVGLGGFASVELPGLPGLSLAGSLHYAPSLLSFGDSDDMTSVELRTSYRIIRNAEVFAGYRYLNTGIEDSSEDVDLDKGIILGMKIIF